jgi:hypothetical protein
LEFFTKELRTMSSKPASQEQIALRVQTLDALAQSGLGTQAFAQAHNLSYTQLRAWQNHEARWRARLAGQVYRKPLAATPAPAGGFAQLKLGASAQPQDTLKTSAASVRIECSQGGRSAVLHWPADAPMQCAQWLTAYLA